MHSCLLIVSLFWNRKKWKLGRKLRRQKRELRKWMIWNAGTKTKWTLSWIRCVWSKWYKRIIRIKLISSASKERWSARKSRRQFIWVRRRKRSSRNIYRLRIDNERISSMIKSHRRILKRIIWLNSKRELLRWSVMSSWDANRWRQKLS
jgi:hypothetical protein